MGNRNTTAEKLDSSDEGGSDYEHKYDFHTSVLRKSPYDGFESDYEDEDEYIPPVLRKGRQNLAVGASGPAEPQQIGDGGDGNSADKGTVSVVAETAVSSSKGEALGGEDGGLKPEGAKAGDENTAPGPVTVSGTATPHPGSSKAGSKNKNAEDRSQAQGKSSPSQATRAATQTLRGLEAEPVDVEDVYETAGEGAGDVENDAEASDDDSLSTITPPRTRAQSDSEYSIDMESDSDSEEGEVRSQSGEHNTMATSPHGSLSQEQSVKTPHRGNRSPAQASGHTLRSSSSRTSPSSQRPLPHRGPMSPNSYRQTRKRRLTSVATPPESRRAEVPHKRMKQITRAAGSPKRVHYGYISSDSESEPERNVKKRSSPRMASPSEQVRGMRETARTIRQAARRAATQIVETSWKIMEDAKAAAKKIRGSASKRRSSAVDDGIEMTTAVKPSMVARREWKDENRNDGSSDSDAARATRNARRTVKRKASPAECSPPNTSRRLRHSRESRTDHVKPEHSYPQADTDHSNAGHSPQEVRKNGGLLRKFTRNQHIGGESSGSQVPPSSRVPVVILSASNNQQKIASKPDSSISGARVCAMQHTKVKSTSEQGNPFSGVLLVPTSQSQVHSNNGALTDSTDSISMELDPAAQYRSTNLIFKNPFSSLLTEPGTLQPVTFTSGSVWARVNMRTNHPQQTEAGEPTVQEKHSPTPEPSSHRMATRSSPLQVNSSPQATNSSPRISNSSPQASNSSPQASNSGQQSRNTSPQLRNSSPQVSKPSLQQAVNSPQRLATPRVPSLTLTGQFAQSGRFAFLLEDVLQVTVASGDITKTSTNAIVISTDRQLRHQNPLARSVATAAGPGFGWACQEYLGHNTQGLQVCEVLDTPAGGQLPKQTSRVLHVVVPGVDNPQESGDFAKERKMLLCTFVNCLKYASEKLKLNTIAFPLVGAGTYPADECIQVFFDSLLVYLAERTCTCPLHGIHLVVNNAAIGRFAAEVLESRLEAMVIEGVDSAITAVFKDYFNIPDFTRGGNSSSAQAAGERNLSGKPAVKRRRL